MQMVILGLIVLSAYLLHPPDRQIRRLDERVRGIGPIGNWPRVTTGGTKAGASPTRPPSASTTTDRRFAWAWRPRSPVNPSRFPERGWSPGFNRGFRFGWSWRRRAALPRPATQGNAARQARRPRVRPRLRRPGERSGNGPRFPGTARAGGDRQPAKRGPRRRNAGVDQSRAHARPDRPQPGPEHRGPGLGGPEGLGSPRRTDRRGVAAGHSRDRHRRSTGRPPTRTTARRSARFAESRSSEARSLSAPSAIRRITAIAGSTWAPVRSMAAMARSVWWDNAVPIQQPRRPPCHSSQRRHVVLAGLLAGRDFVCARSPRGSVPALGAGGGSPSGGTQAISRRPGRTISKRGSTRIRSMSGRSSSSIAGAR